MTACVVIVTKNRLPELRVALRSAFAQSVTPEVLVVDDGSTDGTAAAVAVEFPGARLIAHRESRGLIRRRNEAAAATAASIVFSIDDDAELMSSRTVEQTLHEFDDPRIGAVAIPCIEPHKSCRPVQQVPEASGCWVTDSYVGTAHAVRRDLFLSLGGYREELVHQGEERDYCLRMLAAGYLVRLGHADAIHHYESPKRDLRRMDYYGRRNDVLFAWHYAPLPALMTHLAGTTINAVRSAIAARRWQHMMRGTLAGYAQMRRDVRTPVPIEIYRLHRRLKSSAGLPLAGVAETLPATTRTISTCSTP